MKLHFFPGETLRRDERTFQSRASAARLSLSFIYTRMPSALISGEGSPVRSLTRIPRSSPTDRRTDRPHTNRRQFAPAMIRERPSRDQLYTSGRTGLVEDEIGYPSRCIPRRGTERTLGKIACSDRPRALQTAGSYPQGGPHVSPTRDNDTGRCRAS